MVVTLFELSMGRCLEKRIPELAFNCCNTHRDNYVANNSFTICVPGGYVDLDFIISFQYVGRHRKVS